MRNLSARHGAFAMSSVSLTVPSGELLVLLGPSGAGKTLLLESILGLKAVTEGSITIDDREVTHLPPEERSVAYMPQDVALFPHLSVKDNILFGRRVRRTLEGADAQLADLAEKLHIGHLVDRPDVRSLSGGEQQRVALARALIVNPRVLFLDESFSALDAHIRRELLLALRDLQQALELTVVYVTHSQGEALVVGDRVAILMAGETVQIGAPGDVFRRPADLRVAKFLQLANVFPVDDVSGRGCRVKGLDITLAEAVEGAGAESWLGIGSNDVLVLLPGEADELGLEVNCFPGRVAAVDARHPRSRLRVTLDGANGLTLSCELGARHRVIHGAALAAGDAVEVHLSPALLALFPSRIALDAPPAEPTSQGE